MRLILKAVFSLHTWWRLPQKQLYIQEEIWTKVAVYVWQNQIKKQTNSPFLSLSTSAADCNALNVLFLQLHPANILAAVHYVLSGSYGIFCFHHFTSPPSALLNIDREVQARQRTNCPRPVDSTHGQIISHLHYCRRVAFNSSLQMFFSFILPSGV